MANDIKLPQLGQTMEEGTIVTILIKEGDQVSRGDIIVEVETDKATLEVESSADGFVKKVLVQEGQTIPVGSSIAVLGDQHEEVDQAFIDSLGGSAAPTAVTETTAEAASVSEPAAEKKAAPAVSDVEAPTSAKVVKLPQLGQTMEEGTVVTVLVKEGDQVSRGDIVFEVETDKATLEMESSADGVVKAILVSEGQTVPVNSAMLVLADEDEEISQAYIDSLSSPAATTATESAVGGSTLAVEQSTGTVSAPVVSTGKVFASPRAKASANELGIDLARVNPAPGAHRIVEADVLAAAKAGIAAGPTLAGSVKLGERIPVNKLQRITAERMLQSKREIPCFYLTIKADVTDMVELRKEMNKQSGVKVTFNDFIVRATAMALRHYPIMTGQREGDFIRLAEDVHVALAISVGDGLISPIIKDADKKSLVEVADYSADLVTRTRAGKVTLDDLEGACITISNLGGFGISSFIPVVVPGQCSIIGVGGIADTCVPSGRDILIRKMMTLTLSVDHKVANGAEAAQFLDFIKKTLEHPASIE